MGAEDGTWGWTSVRCWVSAEVRNTKALCAHAKGHVERQILAPCILRLGICIATRHGQGRTGPMKRSRTRNGKTYFNHKKTNLIYFRRTMNDNACLGSSIHRIRFRCLTSSYHVRLIILPLAAHAARQASGPQVLPVPTAGICPPTLCRLTSPPRIVWVKLAGRLKNALARLWVPASSEFKAETS